MYRISVSSFHANHRDEILKTNFVSPQEAYDLIRGKLDFTNLLLRHVITFGEKFLLEITINKMWYCLILSKDGEVMENFYEDKKQVFTRYRGLARAFSGEYVRLFNNEIFITRIECMTDKIREFIDLFKRGWEIED